MTRPTKPTPKQVLRQHIIGHHSPRHWPAGFDRMTYTQLQRWHADRHHRSGGLSHYHAGPNRGPSERPPGWYTGEDVVLRKDRP